ncbi:MAG: membrane protein insertase YidC [Propionibacteriaceae bacterium]|jgi:YidC/Oxa1 family membrane protein insertase|nr:membrane protein insertase YidC [Propionibacteriaceae bacterium]
MKLLPLLLPLDFFGDIGNFFTTIIQPIYWAMSWILATIHNFLGLFLNPNSGWTWALSIILLTMVVRLALVPLFVKQINSSRNMQLLQPKVKALQEKYGADRERLGQETMKLYKEEGVNPMASCFPILLQMPVFFSLFWVLRDVAMKSYKGVFADDHASADSLYNADLFGARLSGMFLSPNGEPFVWGPVQTLGVVLIISMTVTLFITQLQLMRKNMPPEALTGPMAQQQKMMLYLFPLMYLVGGLYIPIGVMIYWLTTNLWTMGQQYILIHNNPAPNTPAYIDWEERMVARGKDPQAILAKRRGNRRRNRAQPSDPNKVARQSSERPDTRKRPVTRSSAPENGAGAKPGPAKPGSAKSGPAKPASADDGAKTVIKRQQQPKVSRAQRKKPNAPQAKNQPNGPKN